MFDPAPSTAVRIACANGCGRVGSKDYRLLCRGCFSDAVTRSRFPTVVDAKRAAVPAAERCFHCRKWRANQGRRGMCRACYTNPAVRALYPVKYGPKPPDPNDTRPKCRHCKVRGVNRPRGLCWPCYYTPGVKDSYPSTSKYAHRGVGGGCHPSPVPAWSTRAEPGSEAKIQAMIGRASRGESLFHPDDPRAEVGSCLPWTVPEATVHCPVNDSYRVAAAVKGIARRGGTMAAFTTCRAEEVA